MEKDDEVKGAGNSMDFGNRIYDNRLGKWLSPDNLFYKYPYLSPYNFAANNPILFVDNNGDDFFCYKKGVQKQVIKILNQTFGKNNGFSFDGNNQLIHNGQGMSLNKSQRIVFDYFMDKVVNNRNIEYEFFGFNLYQINFKGSVIPVQEQNAVTVTQFDPTGKMLSGTGFGVGAVNALDNTEGVYSKRATVFWHEVGHPIATQLYPHNRFQAQKWTVGFENISRDIFKMPHRSGAQHGVDDPANPGHPTPGSNGSDDNPEHFKGKDNFDIRPKSEPEWEAPKNAG